MATIKIDNGTIEKTEEVATRYKRRDLVLQRKTLRLEIDELNYAKQRAQDQIAVLNALIAEMDALNATDEG